MSNVKVGIIGCGRISNRHKDAILAVDGIEITKVCDIDEKKAKSLAEELKVPYVTEISEMNGCDVLTIATPSGLHPRHAMEVAKKTDCKYIIVEKPVSLTYREAVEMFDYVKKYNKTLLPVYQNRYNPLVDFTKTLIEEQKLGKIYQFSINIFWNRNEDYYKDSWHGTMSIDGGVLYTQASHYVDMLHFFFGKVVDAKGFGGRLRGLEAQDTVSAIFQFENGAVGNLNTTASTYKQNYRTECTIIGEKGTVRLAGTNLNEIEFWDVEGMEKPDMDFKIDHIYGKGHDFMYDYIVKEQWDKFPKYDEVLDGVKLMEKLSF